MNARSISRIAVESSLMLVRLPLDAVIGRLPGNGTGTPTARLALDCADATLRAFAGTMLGDSALREGAQTRRAALKERERAQAREARLRRKPRRPMPGSRSVRIRLPASARRRNCARRAAAT